MTRSKKLSNMLRVDTGLRLLNSIISHQQLGIILIDLDGTIMFANSLVNGLLQKRRESVRNMSVFKFVQSSDAQYITSIVSELLINDNAKSPIHKIRLKVSDTQYQVFETYGIGVYSDAGMLECVELCLKQAGTPEKASIS